MNSYGRLALSILLIALPSYAQSDSTSPDSTGNQWEKSSSIKTKFSAYIMADYSDLNQIAERNSRDDEFYIRRARAAIDIRFYDIWKIEFKAGINSFDTSLDVKDAYLEYRGKEWLRILIGRTRFPFGLEGGSGPRNLSFIERSTPTQAFENGRQDGLLIYNHTKRYGWNIGGYRVRDYQIDGLNEESGQDSNHYVGRFTYRPYYSENMDIHLGVNITYEDWDRGEYQLKARPEAFRAKRLIIGRTLNPKAVNTLSSEFAIRYQSLLVQAEAFSQTIDVSNQQIQSDTEYSGYYAQAAYLLNNKIRKYKNGRFNKIRKKDLSGTTELAIRTSHLSGIDNEAGSKSHDITLAINYYVSNQLKLAINYLDSQIDRTTSFEQDGNVLSARIQYQF